MLPVRLCFCEARAESLPSGGGSLGKGCISSLDCSPMSQGHVSLPHTGAAGEQGYISTTDWNSLKHLFFSSPLCHQVPLKPFPKAASCSSTCPCSRYMLAPTVLPGCCAWDRAPKDQTCFLAHGSPH